jgi:hypothetical protein
MSDGPHRSLPMRPGWKRVAEYGDNRAFAPQEVCNAIPAALEEDCRAEMAPRFLDAYCDVFRNQESSLFKDQVAPQLEALRGLAGLGMGRVVLDHAIQLCESGETGTNAAVKAVADALTDRAREARDRLKSITAANRRNPARITCGRESKKASAAAALGLKRWRARCSSSTLVPPPARQSSKGLMMA